MATNPFDRFGLDPRADPETLTARLRELAEDADEATRDELRAAWERLVTHPRERLRLAVHAFPAPTVPAWSPETRAPLPRPDVGHALEPPLGPADLELRPSVVRALAAGSTPHAAARRELPPVLPPFERDPLLREEP